ncbi:hypothetical protein V8E52_011340 [Russula decolorans]
MSFLRLVGTTDIEDALQKLDKLTADEVWMVAAQGSKAIQCVSNGMKVIEDRITEGGEKTIDAIQALGKQLWQPKPESVASRPEKMTFFPRSFGKGKLQCCERRPTQGHCGMVH